MTTPLTPAGLRCAHLTDPLGVAPDRVSLSWQLAGTGPGRAQTSYQLVVTQEEGPAAWDSGRVRSSEQAGLGYQGHPLARGGRYTWRVRVWDEQDKPSAWSEPARFEIELDPADGWRASWIGLGPIREEFKPPAQAGPSDPLRHALGPAPYLRRDFAVGQPVAWARLYVTALGLYEARLNGHRVGDAVLAPGWTDYAQRIAYQTYDVTALIQPGGNVLGALLADGWYAGFFGFDAKRAGAHYGPAPELLAQLVIGLADGTTQWVVTDGLWQAAFAAIRHADLLMGERHDLAREPHGWDRPGFGAAGWRPVQVRDRDGRPLVADPGPPVRVTEEIQPASVSHDGAGRLIADFGQNLTGWLRVAVHGPAASVRIRHAEVLAADGGLYTDNLRTARQTDEFAAPGPATFEPRFTLHGFRYAEITGYPGQPGPGDIVARVAHSDIPAAGSFGSSAPWLDQLFRNIDWGQRGNFISVPTDCPQRDERLGWLGDAQVFARTACYNRDVAAFFDKWLDDVADAQYPSGAFSDIAPRLNVPWAGAPAWGDAGVVVPWTLYTMYGDAAVLRRHFGAMTRWMDFVERDNPDYLRTRNLGNSYNDWLAPGVDETSPELLATAYWAYDAALMAEIADAAGRPGPGRRVPGAAGQDRGRVRGRLPGRRRPAHLGHPDRVRARPAHAADPGRAAGGRGRPPGRRDPAGRLAPVRRVRRGRLPAAGAVRHRAHRRGLPAAGAGLRAVLAVHGGQRRDHDLGALGRLDRAARLPVRVDELVQSLRARLGRRVAVPVRARHRPGAGRGRVRPAAGPAAPGRLAARGPRRLPLGARADLQRMAARRRHVPVHHRHSAERQCQHPGAQLRPGGGAGRDR